MEKMQQWKRKYYACDMQLQCLQLESLVGTTKNGEEAIWEDI